MKRKHVDFSHRRFSSGGQPLRAEEGPIDERLVFTRDELIAAYELVMPEKQATAEVDAVLQEDGLTRSYHTHLAEGTLDLLSLVSEDCAERAWRLLGISRDEGERRREEFRQRVSKS